jgi:hypothetical protein
MHLTKYLAYAGGLTVLYTNLLFYSPGCRQNSEPVLHFDNSSSSQELEGIVSKTEIPGKKSTQPEKKELSDYDRRNQEYQERVKKEDKQREDEIMSHKDEIINLFDKIKPGPVKN